MYEDYKEVMEHMAPDTRFMIRKACNRTIRRFNGMPENAPDFLEALLIIRILDELAIEEK